MTHDAWLERADVYALGALDGEERAWFEEHLSAGCSQCEERLAASREAAAWLARSLPTEVPSAEVKRRLFARIAREATPPIERRRSALSWSRVAGAVAAMAAVLVVGFLAWDAWTMRRLIGERDTEIRTLQEEKARRKEVYWLLENPQVLTIALAGQAPSPGAAGRFLWLPDERRGLLLTRGLPEAPAGKAYALWAIGSDGPVPAGLFSVDRMGRAQLAVSELAAPGSGRFRQFAVTLEPAAGGPLPTGPMHLAGFVDAKEPA